MIMPPNINTHNPISTYDCFSKQFVIGGGLFFIFSILIFIICLSFSLVSLTILTVWIFSSSLYFIDFIYVFIYRVKWSTYVHKVIFSGSVSYLHFCFVWLSKFHSSGVRLIIIFSPKFSHTIYGKSRRNCISCHAIVDIKLKKKKRKIMHNHN